MKKLTKADIYAINYLYTQHKEVAEIAKELKIAESAVQKIIDSLPKKTSEVQPAKNNSSKDLMIKQTAVKKNPVAIMTEGAAQRNDEFVKNIDTHIKNTNSYIFRRPE